MSTATDYDVFVHSFIRHVMRHVIIIFVYMITSLARPTPLAIRKRLLDPHSKANNNHRHHKVSKLPIKSTAYRVWGLNYWERVNGVCVCTRYTLVVVRCVEEKDVSYINKCYCFLLLHAIGRRKRKRRRRERAGL